MTRRLVLRYPNAPVMRQFNEDMKTPNPIVSRFLAIHLYTEFWINRLVESRVPTKKEILTDHRAYTFGVKLAILRNMDLIPEPLYQNIRVLNKIRNGYAHNLGFDFRSLLPKIRAWVPYIAKLEEIEQDDDGTAVKWVGLNTYVWLHALCDLTHRISERTSD